jgi:hypothetical protein
MCTLKTQQLLGICIYCNYQIVHAGQVLDVLVEGDAEGWKNGDGPGQKDSFPTLPLQVQEALHYKLEKKYH